MTKILLKTALIVLGIVCICKELMDRGSLLLPVLFSMMCLISVYLYEFLEKKESKEKEDK